MRSISHFLFAVAHTLKRAHWLSLDVVLGAVLMHVAVSRLPDGQGDTPWVRAILVGIAVFIIYALDRWLDNEKVSQPHTPRHRFYHKHRILLAKIMIGLAIVGVILLFWLPTPVLISGGILATLVGLYIWAVYQTPDTHPLHSWKEPLVMLGYTAGIWLPAYWTVSAVTWEFIVLILLFGLLTFQNLLLFSWYESLSLDEGNTLAIVWGTENVGQWLGIITVMVVAGSLGVALVTSYHYVYRLSLTLGMMSFLTYLLKVYAPSLLPQERYRWLGDGVFLLSAWLL